MKEFFAQVDIYAGRERFTEEYSLLAINMFKAREELWREVVAPYEQDGYIVEVKLLDESNNKVKAGLIPVKAMARVGYFARYEIIIRTDDAGNIPHFHIMDTSTHGKDFHTCVQITEAKYFHHTGKEDILNSKERKMLQEFMSTTNKEDEYRTNWQVIVIEWNRNNSNAKLDYKQIKEIQPDYRELR